MFQLSSLAPVGDFTAQEEDTIRRALAILERRLTWQGHGEPLHGPGDVGRYLCLRLGACDREVFGALFLDNRRRMICFEELFAGGLTSAEVHAAVVARRALLHNAAAVALAHNHPSGNTEPSAADCNITARVKAALHLVDVQLLDHFVVSGDQSVSLAVKGWV